MFGQVPLGETYVPKKIMRAANAKDGKDREADRQTNQTEEQSKTSTDAKIRTWHLSHVLGGQQLLPIGVMRQDEGTEATETERPTDHGPGNVKAFKGSV